MSRVPKSGSGRGHLQRSAKRAVQRSSLYAYRPLRFTLLQQDRMPKSYPLGNCGSQVDGLGCYSLEEGVVRLREQPDFC